MSVSPPPTPPVKVDKSRFKSIMSPCEWVEEYRPGGYHPVTLGDFFQNGQYKVIRKLGEGSFSTVWLARDLKNTRYVALKILVAKISGSTNELRILHHIAEVAPADSPYHMTSLLDEFEHEGPNGVHKCLVFEPMGPIVSSMVEELPQFKPQKWGMTVRYPIWMAKSLLKQSLQGLEFLHRNGIAHGDFQPGNILFALNNIDSSPEHDLRQPEDEVQKPGTLSASISPPVKRIDGKQDRWAPRYLCVAQPLAQFTHHGQGFRVKLSDMGGAYFFTDPPAKPLTPIGLRAPEAVLTGASNNTLDIWSFGCLVFEFITGLPLFCIPSDTFQDDDLLLSMTEQLGALPEDLYTQWKTSSLYFTPDRKIFNWELGGVQPGKEPLVLERFSMEHWFDDAKPDLDEEEAIQVKALIRWILQYDPSKRPSAAEILLHPWFLQINVDGELPKAETGPV